MGLGEKVLRVRDFVVASLVALWLGVTLASMAWNRCVDARISSVLRRTVGDKMPGVRVEYVACGRYCLATGTRFLRFTVEAGAPAASVAAADQMERGGAGVDPPALKPPGDDFHAGRVTRPRQRGASKVRPSGFVGGLLCTITMGAFFPSMALVGHSYRVE